MQIKAIYIDVTYAAVLRTIAMEQELPLASRVGLKTLVSRVVAKHINEALGDNNRRSQ